MMNEVGSRFIFIGISPGFLSMELGDCIDEQEAIIVLLAVQTTKKDGIETSTNFTEGYALFYKICQASANYAEQRQQVSFFTRGKMYVCAAAEHT